MIGDNAPKRALSDEDDCETSNAKRVADEAQPDSLQASHTWEAFTRRHARFIDDTLPKAQTKTMEVEANISEQKRLAGAKIGKWWQKKRQSGQSIPVRPSNRMSAAFRALLNIDKQGNINPKIKRTLNADRDQRVLAWIEQGSWDISALGLTPLAIQASVFSLFAQGKLTFRQHTTLSDILGTQACYGNYTAYDIFDDQGEFTDEAKQYLLPQLTDFRIGDKKRHFSDSESQQFKHLMLAAPKSEQKIFVFHEQKLDDSGSAPAKNSILTEQLASAVTGAFPVMLLNVPSISRFKMQNYLQSAYTTDMVKVRTRAQGNERVANITSKEHPLSLSYQGVLRFSASIEDARGIVSQGIDNWEPLVPRIGKQTIDDIDEYSQHYARPTLTPHAIRLGISKPIEQVHGSNEAYPSSYAHDNFHRIACSAFGRHVLTGLDKLIQLGRDTFDFKWSKDLWLIRDTDYASMHAVMFLQQQTALLKDLKTLDDEQKRRYVTQLFSSILRASYVADQLDNCDDADIDKFAGHELMTTPSFEPNQFMLCFVIDLITHPEKWRECYISDELKHWQNDQNRHGIMPRLVEMAHYLHGKGLFGADMKENVLFFESFVKKQSPHYDFDLFIGKMWKQTWQKPSEFSLQEQIAQAKQVAAEKEAYAPHRDNSKIFLGFRKK